MKKIKTDTGLFVKIMWASYILSTIISATFNIIMLREIGITTFDKILMVSASIALEGVKAAILIKANTFRSMYRKIKIVKLCFAMITSYTSYFLFALLSITAGLGFSMTATAKQESAYSNQIEAVRMDISTLAQKEEVYKEALTVFENLQNNYDGELKDSRDNVRKAEDELKNYYLSEEYLSYMDKNRRYYSVREEFGASSQEWIDWNNNYQIEKTKVLSEESRLKTVLERQKEDYSDIESGKALSRAESKLELATEDYDSFKNEFGDNNSLLKRERILIDEENKNTSSGKMFVLFANTLFKGEYTANDEEVRMIKFWILLLISILIEMAIFTCSPDVVVERTLLERFKHYLPDDMDVTKIIKIFEVEQKKFLYDEEESKPKIKKTRVKKEVAEIKPVTIEKPPVDTLINTPEEEIIMEPVFEEEKENSKVKIRKEKKVQESPKVIVKPVTAKIIQTTPKETKKEKYIPNAEDQIDKLIEELEENKDPNIVKISV